jgi:polar amino acid transport system substrate-binding protein
MKKLLLLVIVGLIFTSMVLTSCGSGQKIRVATDATWPPFEYVNEQTKEIEGFDIDLFKAIAEKEGLEVEFINVAWDPLLAGMASCQYDVAISSISILPERQEKMLFSDPYFKVGQLVTVRKDNTDITSKDDLAGKIAGAQIGTTGAFAIEDVEGATLKTYDDIGLAFQDLINGQIDAVVADNPLAYGYVGKNSDKLKTVGEVFTSEDIGIAVCKTKPDLLKKINSGLNAVMEEGLIEELIDKWLVKQ